MNTSKAIDKKMLSFESSYSTPKVVVDSQFVEKLRNFLQGNLTWAQVEGWTPQISYRFAVLGFDLMKSGKLKESEKIFSSLKAINPKDWYFSYSLAQIERLLGNHEKALLLLDESISIEPQLGEPWLLKGICQMEKGDNEEAKKSLKKARDLGKNKSMEKIKSTTFPLSIALLKKLNHL